MFVEADAYPMISRLPLNSHKKSLGSVLIVGGSSLYSGAPFLAGKAALRSGAGLVTVAVPESAGIMPSDIFSLIIRQIPDSGTGFFTKDSIAAIINLANSADSIVIGPGMSDNESCLALLSAILSIDKPIIIDADALNLIAQEPDILRTVQKPVAPSLSEINSIDSTKSECSCYGSKYIFTPHPGEARRLLRGFKLDKFLEKDKISQVKALSEKTGGTVILKGHKSVVAANNNISINGSGCPALATAGSGDVLAGIIAAYSAVGANSFDAACLSVFIHGVAGEIGNKGMRGLIADELIELIPSVLKLISPFA